jgi:hypothetical protein
LREIDFVFFDIGRTLGERKANGDFVPFPSSVGLLKAMATWACALA